MSFLTEPPICPDGFMSTNVQAASATFAWYTPAQTYGQPYNVTLTCSEIADIVDLQHLRNTVSDGTLNHTFYDLQPGATYDCCVMAENAGGASTNTCIRIPTHEAGVSLIHSLCILLEYIVLSSAPSGFPENLRSVVNSTSIATLFWEELPYRQRNGRIRGYIVTVCTMDTEEPCFQVFTNGTQVSTEVHLHPDYKYSCNVSAYTAVGQGPYSDSITFRMPGPYEAHGPVTAAIGELHTSIIVCSRCLLVLMA